MQFSSLLLVQHDVRRPLTLRQTRVNMGKVPYEMARLVDSEKRR